MLNEFIILAIAHIIAVASPGADFAVVLKNTLAAGHKKGTLTAIGVGAGILVHVIYTLFGIGIVLSHSELLFNIVKLSGAAYLLWLAWQGFHAKARRAKTSVKQQHLGISNLQALRQGFFTNVLNPKVTLFFVALFTNIVSFDRAISIQIFYGIWLSVYTMLWFAFVAWMFSRQWALSWYEAHGHYIDWAMSSFLIFVSSKLLLSMI